MSAGQAERAEQVEAVRAGVSRIADHLAADAREALDAAREGARQDDPFGAPVLDAIESTAVAGLALLGRLAATEAAYGPELSRAAGQAARRWHGAYTADDLRQEAAWMVMRNPGRYLTSLRGLFQFTRLVADLNRWAGDRLGARRAAYEHGQGFREVSLDALLEDAALSGEADSEILAALAALDGGQPEREAIRKHGHCAGHEPNGTGQGYACIPGELSLADREREVIDGLTAGVTQAELAAELGVSLSTVERLARSAKRKLAAQHADTVRYGWRDDSRYHGTPPRPGDAADYGTRPGWWHKRPHLRGYRMDAT